MNPHDGPGVNGVRPDTDRLFTLQSVARSLGLEHVLPVAILDPEP